MRVRIDPYEPYPWDNSGDEHGYDDTPPAQGKPLLTAAKEAKLRNWKKLWREQDTYALPDLIVDQDDSEAWTQLSHVSKLASQVTFFSQVCDAGGGVLDLDLEVTHPITVYKLLSEDLS